MNFPVIKHFGKQIFLHFFLVAIADLTNPLSNNRSSIGMIGRVFLAPSQNGHSACKSEAVVDIARTNHLVVFDIATKLYTLDVILEYRLFQT